MLDAISYLKIIGGGRIFYPYPPNGFVLNNVTTDVSDIEIDFMFIEVRKIIGTGYMLRWENSLSIKNVKVRNAHLKGDNTQMANAGLGFALTLLQVLK